MIPGRLYRNLYTTQVWSDITFDPSEKRYYVSNLQKYMQQFTVFMIIESIEDYIESKSKIYTFSKVLDTNGDIGYIITTNFNELFKEATE